MQSELFLFLLSSSHLYSLVVFDSSSRLSIIQSRVLYYSTYSLYGGSAWCSMPTTKFS